MKVTVNGKEQEVPRGATVASLLAALEVPTDGVAVAIDREVVPKSRHDTTPLSEGASVEILRAVGGG